jgi:hypothetical protein
MKFLSILVLFIASIAMTNANARQLTYQQFVDSCSDPARYGQQVPPTQIKLVCKHAAVGWQAIESGSVALPESRTITGELFSNKFTVGLQRWSLATPEFNVMCPRVREVASSAEIEVSLTCEQITSDDRSVEEHCQDNLDAAISQNPDIVVHAPTGRIYSVCGDVTQK